MPCRSTSAHPSADSAWPPVSMSSSITSNPQSVGPTSSKVSTLDSAPQDRHGLVSGLSSTDRNISIDSECIRFGGVDPDPGPFEPIRPSDPELPSDSPLYNGPPAAQPERSHCRAALCAAGDAVPLLLHAPGHPLLGAAPPAWELSDSCGRVAVETSWDASHEESGWSGTEQGDKMPEASMQAYREASLPPPRKPPQKTPLQPPLKTPRDASRDASPDASPDTSLDASLDASPDASLDGSPDASPDASTFADTLTEAETGSGRDVSRAGRDSSRDTSPTPGAWCVASQPPPAHGAAAWPPPTPPRAAAAGCR
mmetsp:Transcript_24986/g.78802  ORF Transcript_24986/g.78802 Transcript_24986/m.78802 type:complete len:312 (-) Transcript_24986:63-998(-)